MIFEFFEFFLYFCSKLGNDKDKRQQDAYTSYSTQIRCTINVFWCFVGFEIKNAC